MRRAVADGRAVFRRLLGLEAIVAAVLIATVLAIIYRAPLTTETLALGPEGLGQSYFTYSYDDRGQGGSSTSAVKPPLDWSCELADTHQYRYCGFGIAIAGADAGRGIDLSDYDSIKATIHYEGRAEYLRMVLKNHDDRYGLIGMATADQPNQATITVASAEQGIPAQLSDFTVAEWWKDQVRLPPEKVRPEFSNVVAIEFVTGADAYAGLHRLRLHRLEFQRQIISTEAWYGGLAACWALLIASLIWQRRRQAQSQKIHLARELRITLDTIPQIVWTYVDDGTVHFNRRWEDFTGVALGRDPGVKPWDLLHPDDRKIVISAWQKALRTGEDYELEYRVRHRSGDFRWMLAQAVRRTGECGRATWYGTCTDVHDRVLAEQALKDSIASERVKSRQLKWMSEHDVLTGLPNRRAFQARLRAAILRAMDSGGMVGLLLIDIDHFKHVNDSFGHLAGDDLLKGIAKRLTDAMRDGDFAARVGGDEFAVLLERINSSRELMAVGEASFNAIQAPVKVGRRIVSAGASIGGALFPMDAASADDLFKNADTALYALKSSGRGGTLMFHGLMLEEAEKAASQLSFARSAVSDASVVPFYQAKVDIASGSVLSFEALLRWQHPANGLQLPDTLEEAFKDYELAARIGELMQRKVAADIRSWINKGVPFGRVSINAAPAEFLRDDYAERLLGELERAGLPPEAIEIEVTEHAFVERGRTFVARALKRLREAGVHISLDDFGTGSSSLSHLRDFPVDRVKIDKSFVQQMTYDPEIAAIVGAVVNLARSLSIEVVAEGVETQQQLDLLRSMGCHQAQGHFFSAAVPSTSVPEVLSMRKAA